MSNPTKDSRMAGLRKLLVSATADAAKFDAIKHQGDYDAQLFLLDRLTHHFAQALYLLEPVYDEVATQVFAQQQRAIHAPAPQPEMAAKDLAAPVRITALHTFTTEANRRLQVMEEITCAPLLRPWTPTVANADNPFLQAFEEVTNA